MLAENDQKDKNVVISLEKVRFLSDPGDTKSLQGHKPKTLKKYLKTEDKITTTNQRACGVIVLLKENDTF